MIQNKVLILIGIIFLNTCLALGQKYDYQWLFGYKTDTSIIHPDFGRSVIDFSTSPPDIYYEDRNINLDLTVVSICDTSGNLLFYTNGIVVVNHLHEIMENGNGLNPGAIANSFEFWGYPNIQGALALPLPNSDSIFYLIHQRIEYSTPNLPGHGSTLFLTQIDMGKNNGLGKVITKNEPIINDILEIGNLTATKHANGRDWWILHGKFDSNQFYTLLLTPDGLENHGIQEVGTFAPTGIGQAIFSPDGSKYTKLDIVSANTGSFLNIYDFDRCTGQLSNHIQMTHADSVNIGGVAISPNSRYLYMTARTLVFQYDLWAMDIEASKDTVAIHDGYFDSIGLSPNFFLTQLAPNGKIYINSSNSVKDLHVINSPDSAGLACNLEQHSLQLPTYNKFSLPNFPNYRLGALSGSICDSLTTAISTTAGSNDILLYPNPANDFIIFDGDNEEGNYTFILNNLIGQEIYQKEVFIDNETLINLPELPVGTYIYNLVLDGKIEKTGKLIIGRK